MKHKRNHECERVRFFLRFWQREPDLTQNFRFSYFSVLYREFYLVFGSAVSTSGNLMEFCNAYRYLASHFSVKRKFSMEWFPQLDKVLNSTTILAQLERAS